MATYKLLRGNHVRQEMVDGQVQAVLYDPRKEGHNIIEMEPAAARRLNKLCSVLDGPRLILLKESVAEVKEKSAVVLESWEKLSDMHWKQIVKIIEDMDDSDQVLNLLSAEQKDKKRASVINSAKARVSQLTE